jgi:hypothetical protein
MRCGCGFASGRRKEPTSTAKGGVLSLNRGEVERSGTVSASYTLESKSPAPESLGEVSSELNSGMAPDLPGRLTEEVLLREQPSRSTLGQLQKAMYATQSWLGRKLPPSCP